MAQSRSKLSPIWRRICRTCVDNVQVWDFFLSRFHTKIRSGTITEFWNNSWFGDFPLNVVFPSLFGLAIDKHCSVESMLFYLIEENVFMTSASNGVRRRRLRNSEIADVVQMRQMVQNVGLTDGVLNVVYWKPTNNSFSVSSYTELFFSTVIDQDEAALYSLCWKSEAPPLVKFFIWLFFRGRISSKSFLVSRGILASSEGYCHVCAEWEDHNSWLCSLFSDVVLYYP